jgi:rhodanese-related sulfurtransferase
VWFILGLAVLIGICGCALTQETSSKTVQSISKESLKSKLEDPSIVILDVRRPQDWKKSGIKIKGAVQENPYKFDSWHSRYPKTKTVILY